jgi:ureidoglycolate hydrolase
MAEVQAVRSTVTPAAGVIRAEPLSADAFAPYGAVLEARPDGVAASAVDSRLDLSRGRPRFYVMELADQAPRFDRLTSHRAVTQCLASASGELWLLAVAPPDAADEVGALPDLSRLAAFVVPGGLAVLLHRGTWHAGPFFTAPSMSFFNLELSDTNIVDHDSVALDPAVQVVA